MPISRSINALTTHVRANAREIEALCLEIEELAVRPDSRFSDFQVLLRKLSGRGVNIPVGYKESIASAFLQAGRLDPEPDPTRGPTTPRHRAPDRLTISGETGSSPEQPLPEGNRI